MTSPEIQNVSYIFHRSFYELLINIYFVLKNLLLIGTGTGTILSRPGTTKSLLTGYGNGMYFNGEGTGTGTGEGIVTIRGGDGTGTGTGISFSTGTGYGGPRM